MWTLAMTLSAWGQSWPPLQPVATGDGKNDAHVEDVPGAEENANAWIRWFVEGRKIRANPVVRALNGDVTDIQIRALAETGASLVPPGGTLWFVQRSALLQPLEAGAQGKSLGVLDACFSGQTASGAPFVSGLQPMLREYALGRANPTTRGLTAAGNGEFAGALPGLSRPAFCTLALGGLMGWANFDGGDRDGKVTAVEVQNYVQGALNLSLHGRTQTVTLLVEDVQLGTRGVSSAPRILEIVGSTEADLPRPTDVVVDVDVSALDRARCEAAATAAGQTEQDGLLAAELSRQREVVRQRRSGLSGSVSGCPTEAAAGVRAACEAALKGVVDQAGGLRATVAATRIATVAAASRAVEAPEVAMARGTGGGAPAGFARIGPGTFTMGSPANEPDRRDNEAQRVVTLTKAIGAVNGSGGGLPPRRWFSRGDP